MRRAKNQKKNQTICWECVNAVPSADGSRGCNWSRKLEPVAGWNATQYERSNNESKPYITWCVHSCPEYVRSEPQKPADEEAYEMLRKSKRLNRASEKEFDRLVSAIRQQRGDDYDDEAMLKLAAAIVGAWADDYRGPLAREKRYRENEKQIADWYAEEMRKDGSKALYTKLRLYGTKYQRLYGYRPENHLRTQASKLAKAECELKTDHMKALLLEIDPAHVINKYRKLYGLEESQ